MSALGVDQHVAAVSPALAAPSVSSSSSARCAPRSSSRDRREALDRAARRGDASRARARGAPCARSRATAARGPARATRRRAPRRRSSLGVGVARGSLAPSSSVACAASACSARASASFSPDARRARAYDLRARRCSSVVELLARRLRVLLGRDQRELALVRLLRARSSAAPEPRSCARSAWCCVEQRASTSSHRRRRLSCELAHLALVHRSSPARDRVAGAAADAAVGVERPCRRGRRACARRRRRAKRAARPRRRDDDRVADERARRAPRPRARSGGDRPAGRSTPAPCERVAAGARPRRRGERANDRGARPSCSRARSSRSARRARRRSTTTHSSTIAEQPRERAGELGRRLDAIGDEAERASGPFGQQVSSRRRPRPRAARASPRARGGGCACCVELVPSCLDGAARSATAPRGARCSSPSRSARSSALVRLPSASSATSPRELAWCARELVASPRSVARSSLRELRLARLHLVRAALEARELRLGGRDLRPRLRGALAQLGDLARRRARRRADPRAARARSSATLGLARLVGLEGGEARLELRRARPPARRRCARRVASARSARRRSALEVVEAVLRARDLGLVRAHLVVGGEGRVLRLLGAVSRLERLGRARPRARPRARRGSVRAACALLGSARSLGLLELLARRDLEQLVRRLVEHQVLELVAVRDVALGLRGLALERARGSARSPTTMSPTRSRFCSRHAPSSARPASSGSCTW